jgi:hypothetical protein
MWFILGWIVSIVTFPGVIVHELAHQLFCRLARVAVFDVCYWRFGNPAGYVVHETPRTAYQSILISIGPFIVNTVVGGLIAAPSALPVLQFNSGTPLDYLLIWLGVSIAMHAFPSTGDAKSIWQSVMSKPGFSMAKVIAAPIVGLIYIGALGSMFWLDLFYGIGVAFLIPKLLIAIFS